MDIFKKSNQLSSKRRWKAGFYIRLSREDVEKDTSIENIKIHNKIESESVISQRAILNDFSIKLEDVDIIGEYVDDGYSGTNFDRPKFEQMIDDVRSKKIDCVIVKDLSRFGRNYAGVGNYLEVVFPLLGVRFISIIDNCDSYLRPESVSNIIIPVKNIINEGYSRDLSLKVKSAFEARKKQGLFIGTYATYGYVKDPTNKNKLTVDVEAAEVVKRIFNDFVNGKTMTKIAYDLNQENVLCPGAYKQKSQGISKYVVSYGCIGWVDRTIRRILENATYTGTLVQKYREKINYKIKKFKKVDKENRIYAEDAVEPIISKELFEKAQNLLKRDTRIEKAATELSTLSGYIHCADCKRGMSKKKSKTWDKKSIINYYVCSSYKNCGKSVCSSHHIRIDKVEECVLQFLKSCIKVAIDFDSLINYINTLKNENVELVNFNKLLKVKQMNKQKKEFFIEGLYPDYRAGILSQSEYLKYKDRATAELEIIVNEIQNLENQIQEIKQGTCVENEFISHFKQYQDIDNLTRQMVVDLIDNVWIHNGNFIEIDIKYKDQYQWATEFVENNKHYLIPAHETMQKAVVNG